MITSKVLGACLRADGRIQQGDVVGCGEVLQTRRLLVEHKQPLKLVVQSVVDLKRPI